MVLDLICKYNVATSLSCFQSEKLETKGLNTRYFDCGYVYVLSFLLDQVSVVFEAVMS